MSARSRTDRKRRGLQYAGVLRDPRLPTSAPELPAVAHSAPRSGDFNWRWVSGLMVLMLTGLLFIFSTADFFYVRSIAVGGLRYLTKEEIFAFTKVANQHIFWIDPERVRQNLLQSPSIAEARVWLDWSPQLLNIVIEEREPAIVWEQSGTALWVDIQGRIMMQREDRPDLVRVSASENVEQGVFSQTGRVDEDIVVGAIQLKELLPEAALLRYDSFKGLGYANPQGWSVWFGVGKFMPEKVAIYRAISQDLLARGIQAGEVNIVDPDAPYYTVVWGTTNP